jgi:ribokinase
MRPPADLIAKSKIVHISSSGDMNFNIMCAKIAHEYGSLVSFDPGNDPFAEDPEYLQNMVRNTDFLFFNDVEMSGILGRLKLGSISQIIVTVISKKDKSATIFTEKRVEKIPSLVSIINDPTGGTDGFIAGFLVGYLRGYDLPTIGRIAACEASFIVEQVGCQTALPSWEDLCVRYKLIFGKEV